ncbi:MAG: FkbM family methyltransferase [Labilithrix sp.]|nr:FkbM family methyltransferase [Labilithrix sp.]MCW5810318.1 FkbM family methyltransferase [Labilithrix sp.]
MLGVPTNSKPTWITKLAGMPVVHKAIKLFRVQQIASRALTVIPMKRRLKRTGMEYRVRFLESLLIADEIFQRGIYREAFEEKEIRTFMDLGSNVGYFPLFAVEETGRRDMIGLVVDGNEQMAEESRWHADHNALGKVHVKFGVVGYPRDVSEATFFVNPSNVASSAQPVLNPDVPAKGESKPVTVPAVDVFGEWRKIAGDARIDLMKVDIEGFESDFIKNSAEALSITDRLVIEWHKWVNGRDAIDALLAEHGFTLRKVISEDPHCGVAIYDKKPTAHA